MKLVKYCASRSGAHFFLLLIAFFVGSLSSNAHTIVLSEYTLEFKDDQWILSFDQKTSQLRDAIYAENPGLKGINLNSEAFLKETTSLISSNLMMMYDGEILTITPQHMHYGGLRFESRFVVEGLPPNPDMLTLKVDGFDTHEHSIVLFRLVEGADAYLNYFNQEQRIATYHFDSKSYVFEDDQPAGKVSGLVYLFVGLVVLAVGLKFIKSRQGNPNLKSG